VTKADIIENVSTQLGFTKKESQDLVESVLSLLKSTLESGENVKISGFGKFEVKQKKDRRGRNPQTGETITIDSRRILSFKPSTLQLCFRVLTLTIIRRGVEDCGVLVSKVLRKVNGTAMEKP